MAGRERERGELGRSVKSLSEMRDMKVTPDHFQVLLNNIASSVRTTSVWGLTVPVPEQRSAADRIPPCGEALQPEEQLLLLESLLWQRMTGFSHGQHSRAV